MLKLFQKKQPVEQPIQNYSEVISSAVSPYYHKSQLRPYNPDEIWQKRGNYDLFDDMLQDDQIGASLNLKKVIILGSGWEIQCEDENIKEFIEDNFNFFLDDIFNKKIYDIMSALGYGNSITEKIFDLKETKWGEKIVLTALKTRAPHGFVIYTDVKGEIEKLEQYTEKGILTLDPNKFIIYSYNKEFDNAYGKSDLTKGVYRAWSAKDAVIRFWNMYLEKHVTPTLIGKMPRTGGDAEKEKFVKILRNITAKTVITMPDDFAIDKIEGSTVSGEFEKAINKYNTIIARTLFIPDLLGYSGSETQGGSYALGKEQFDIFYLGIEYIRKDLQNLINRHLIEPLVKWNFGDYPVEFKFKSLTETQKIDNLKLWLDAVKSGKIPQNYQSVDWFLDNVKAPPITEEEYQKIEDDKNAMAQQIQNGGEAGKQEKKQQGKEDANVAKKQDKYPAENKDEKLQEEKKSIEKEFQLELTRAKTEYEKKINFEKIQKETEAIEVKYKGELAKLFKQSVNGLVDEIKRRKIIENKKLEMVNKLYLKNLSLIKQKMKEMLRDSYALGQAEFKSFAIIKSQDTLDDEDIATWIRENAIYSADMESENIMKIVKDSLFESIRQGYGVDATISALDSALSGFDIDVDASTLERFVRTNVLRAYNQARADEYNKQKDDIVAFQFSAIRDGRTSDVCEALDKKVFAPVDMNYYNPPLHPNCRSVLVPIYRDENFEGYDDMPPTEQVGSGFLKLKKA